MTSQTVRACDHLPLIHGLTSLLHALNSPKRLDTVIGESFDQMVEALRPDRAAVVLVRSFPAPLKCEPLCQRGFASAELSASAGGSGPAEPILARLLESFADQPEGALPESSVGTLQNRFDAEHVLCVPVRSPSLNTLIAFVYLEKPGYGGSPFDDFTRSWVESYASALSHALPLLPSSRWPGPEVRGLFCDLEPPQNPPLLIGKSAAIEALRLDLHEVHIPAAGAADPEPILILGEKGTGKDLVARYIHAYSRRRSAPYVAVNCAEITDELAASRFFGHRKGSFTGSLANEPGLFRAADRGVLFLDEIGELSLRAQASLLRVLENRTVVPLGDTRETSIDVQVILATNRDPEAAVEEGRLRADLLDRFRTQEIRLVPVRERPWDIPALVTHFLAHHEARMKKRIVGLSPDALKTMVHYHWPGNVREVSRVCSSLVAYSKAGAILDEGLLRRLIPNIGRNAITSSGGEFVTTTVTMRGAVEAFEKELILARLREHNWNVRSARLSLGLPKTTFYRYARLLRIHELMAIAE